jgi:hypothetical protein
MKFSQQSNLISTFTNIRSEVNRVSSDANYRAQSTHWAQRRSKNVERRLDHRFRQTLKVDLNRKNLGLDFRFAIKLTLTKGKRFALNCA